MQRKMLWMALLLMGWTQYGWATPAPNNACRQQLSSFLTATYKNAVYLGVKGVNHAEDLKWLNKIEKDALKKHLGYLNLRAPNFENHARYGIGARLQKVKDHQWLVVDVTSDNDGLARTILVYNIKGGSFKINGLYFNDQFNEPVYRCLRR